MRETLGFLLANGMFAAVGLAVLHALGLVPLRPLELAAASGLAFLTGIAGVGLGCLALLVAGIPFTLATIALVAVAEIALAAFAAVRRRGTPDTPTPPLKLRVDRGTALAWGIAAAIVVFFIGEAIAMRTMPVAFDAAHIWTFKATALTLAEDLQPELFDNPVIGHPNFSGQDYPPLQPVFLAILFRAMGGPQPENVPVELWLTSAAFVAACIFLLGRGRGILTLAPAMAGVLAAYGSVLVSNADGTLAIFTALGAICLARWVESGEARFGLLAGLLLGAAANVKIEGILFAAAVLLAGVAVAAWRRPERWAAWAAASAAVTAVAILPWRLWLWSVSPPKTQETAALTDVVNPGWLFDRTSKLDAAGRRTFEVLADKGDRSGRWRPFSRPV
jgi:hypothetical protein